MSNKRYAKRVFENLNKSKSLSLNVLLEEKDDDPFAMPDDGNEEEKSSEDASAEGSDGDSDLFGSSDSESEEDESNKESEEDESNKEPKESDYEKKLDDIADLTRKLDAMSSARMPKSGPVTKSITKEGRNLFDFMLLTEDKDPDAIFKDLEKAIEKNQDVIKTADKVRSDLKSGTEIDVDEEVELAVDRLINFDSKVDIVGLIEELFVNKIRMIAPIDDIEDTIEDFTEKYHNAVSKNKEKIRMMPGSSYYEDESFNIDSGSEYNAASGARSQG